MWPYECDAPAFSSPMLLITVLISDSAPRQLYESETEIEKETETELGKEKRVYSDVEAVFRSTT